jgi:thiamine-monophosphate kinase
VTLFDIVTSVVLPERQIIDRLRRLVGKHKSNMLRRGIGDDCAVLQVAPGSDLLVTTDLCIEDIHFRRKWHPAASVGHRCLARGLSDIAAMGGVPVACFLSLGLAPRLPQKWVDDFMRGFLQLAHRFRVPLAGGDTSAAEKITADIIVLGRVPAGKAVLRSGARPGDKIYVTGELGGSAAALKRLYSGGKLSRKTHDRHFYPEPRLEAGRCLCEKKIATAMIDLSDGLSVDLAHICDESAVSAIIDAAAIPVASGASLGLALHGGEDYELLFTTPANTKLPAKIAGVPVTFIGEIRAAGTRQRVQIREASGKLTPLRPAGWEHFHKK